MSETKWTSGPWAIDDGSRPVAYSHEEDKVIISDDGFVIALVVHDDPPISNPNAHLIAAAPKLYEALSALIIKCGEACCQSVSLDEAIDKAKLALAKARGEVTP